jgi:hypothetical protein
MKVLASDGDGVHVRLYVQRFARRLEGAALLDSLGIILKLYKRTGARHKAVRCGIRVIVRVSGWAYVLVSRASAR